MNKDYLIENIATMIHGGAIPRATTSASESLPSNYKETIEKINSGFRVCVILRGLPGSGKSYIAKRIIADTIQGNGVGHIISADNYFMKGSKYIFDPSKLSEAHSAAQKMFLNNASKGYSPLIIDNTHMKYWEMFCYLQGAVQYHYAIFIMEPCTPWQWNVNLCAQKNTHGVPFEGIKRMKSNYETGCSLEQLLAGLTLQPVAQPKMREIPPMNLIDLQDENLGCEIKQDKNANWHATEPLNPFKWTRPPPQVFEEKPQMQKKKSKEKKDDFVPHRKNCPNENEQFTQLRELYPNITDSYIWDMFLQCKGDSNWVAEILCEENKANDHKGDELSCDCGILKSSSGSSSDTSSPLNRKGQQSNNGRKNTPTRTKKPKNADSDSLKQAIESNIKIGEEFYPEHVKAVKKWKNPLLPIPVVLAENGQPPPSNEVVDLSIDKKLIFELDDRFGSGLLKFSSQEFPQKIFINESTAKQLYDQIMEIYKSQEVESQLEAVKNDHAFAQTLAEIERSEKYPKLFTATNGNLKEIMENEEALKNYERDMNGWQKENETLAIMIKKQRLYKAFPTANQVEINTLFEVLQYDFEATIKMMQENLGYTTEQCNKVKEQLDNDQVWKSESSSDGEVDNEIEEDVDILKTIDDLREQIANHNDERHNCNRIAAEKYQAKDYQTGLYYSNMAALHKQMAEEKHLEVGSAVAELHAQNQTSPTQLDLHYHNIAEASTILQTFIDRNISRLREIKRPYEELSIITGRGAHSKNGIANIKLMTIQQIKERNLRHTEINAGLLKVKIFQNSLLSTDLGK